MKVLATIALGAASLGLLAQPATAQSQSDREIAKAGVFQVDELLARDRRGSGLENHIEVVAEIQAEHEKRLFTVYRI